MPARSAVHVWLATRAEFADQYARAREDQADTLADEIVTLADEAAAPFLRDDGTPLLLPDGKPVMVTTSEAINHARLRVDARKWVAAKLKPKKYGERTAHELSGPSGGPIPLQVTAVDLDVL